MQNLPFILVHTRYSSKGKGKVKNKLSELLLKKDFKFEIFFKQNLKNNISISAYFTRNTSIIDEIRINQKQTIYLNLITCEQK